MKSKILTLIFIAFCYLQHVMGCPVRRIGKMYIVDEKNKPITDVVVWMFYNSNDSFKMGHSGYNTGDNKDTSAYFFVAGRNRSRSLEVNPPKKYLLIKAKGYADVIIKGLKFKPSGTWGEELLPVLYVKMYPKKYVKKGDLFTLMDNYVCEKRLEIEDSLTVDFNDYTESIREANMVANAQRISGFTVKTYPNPVKDDLNIEINALVTKPYKAILRDASGKLVCESLLLAQNSVLDMEWQASGIYFIQIYDPEGVLLYAYKIFKA